MIEYAHTPAVKPDLRGLHIALAITIAMMVVEFAIGLYANSLALLADAGHMASDSAALILTFFAFRLARQPATRTKTYGYYRTEILAAFINGLALWFIVILILFHAVQRILHPPVIKSLPMLAAAIAGLAANLICGWLLFHTKGQNLNLQGAFLNVMADALGSLGVVMASLVIWLTGWRMADPIASIVVCTMIVIGSWRLIAQSVNVLLEGSPAHIDVPTVMREMRQLVGVKAVHDMHVWTITSGLDAMSAHVVVEQLRDGPRILDQLNALLRDRFAIQHTTFQLESPTRKPLESGH